MKMMGYKHIGLIARLLFLNLEMSELPMSLLLELCSNLVGPCNCYINSELEIAYFELFQGFRSMGRHANHCAPIDCPKFCCFLFCG